MKEYCGFALFKNGNNRRDTAPLIPNQSEVTKKNENQRGKTNASLASSSDWFIELVAFSVIGPE